MGVVQEMSVEWECSECGYLFSGRTPPRRCPDCDAVDSWESLGDEDSDDDWDDEGEE
jgi:rubredoxin